MLLTTPPNINILVQHLNSTSRLPHRLLDQNPVSTKQDSPRHASRFTPHASRITHHASRIGTNKEFIQYLVIARGSVSEVKSLAYSGVDIGYINEQAFNEIQKSCTKKLSALLNGFIRYLKNSNRKK